MLARRVRPPFHLALALSCLCVVSTAHADDPAAAEALYKQGRRLLAQKKHDEACEKFRESMELNPRATTVLNLAECADRAGKLVEAMQQLERAKEILEASKMAAWRKRPLEKLANERIEVLQPRIPTLRIVTNSPEGLSVTRDGVEVSAEHLDEEIAMDPGQYEISATAPGFLPVTKSVTLKEGDDETLGLALEAEPVPEKAPPKPPPPEPEPQDEGVPAWSWVVGGVGLVLVGVGIGFKIDSGDAEATLDEMCGTERVCDPNESYDPADDNARKDRSNGLFLGGVVLGGTAVGVAVLGAVLASSGGAPENGDARLTPWVGPTSVGGAMGGTF